MSEKRGAGEFVHIVAFSCTLPILFSDTEVSLLFLRLTIILTAGDDSLLTS